MEKRYLAVDVGGTSIKYGLFDCSGKMLMKDSLPKSERRMSDLVETIGVLYEKEPHRPEGIALSLNMIVNHETGEVYGGSNYLMESDSYPFREMVSERCGGVPVSVDKDSNAAMKAELKTGNLKGAENAIAIILGTGIGMSLCVNGRIFYGDNCFSCEASTIMIGSACPKDPLSAIWVQYNGVPTFIQRTAEEVGEDPELFDGKRLFERIEAGDEGVIQMFDGYCDTLATQIMNLTLLLDIHRIAIGGGISAQPLLFEKLIQKLSELNSFFRPSAKALLPQIVPCKYRNDANLYGAFYSLMDGLKIEIEERNHEL